MIHCPPQRIAQMIAAGHWSTRTLWDMFLVNVERSPDQEAVVDPPNLAELADMVPRRLSWAALNDEVERLAALLHLHGLRRDDIVIVQLPNCSAQVALYLACHRLGLVFSPLPAVYREFEIGHALACTEAAALFTCTRIGRQSHGAMMAALRPAHTCVRQLFVMGPADSTWPADAVAVDTALAGALPIEAMRVHAASIRLSADDVVSICWTSGTEAHPKGVPRSSNEWYWQSKGTVDSVGLQPGMRILNPFPLVNMGGMSSGFVGWLLKGATLVQHHPFDLAVFLQQIRDERIEYTVAPPAILNRLLQNESLLTGIDFTRLKRIGSGSAPLSPWMIETFASHHGVEVLNYFGSNEGAAMCGNAADIPDPVDRATLFPRPQRPGRPPWQAQINNLVQTRLVASDGEREILQPGEAGELRIAGPTVFAGYYRAPELNASAFDAQGYFRTGDLFEIAGDEGQYLRYVGRLKDLVLRGGMKISAEEVESQIASHPGVAEVAVVGVPDAVLGETLCACVAPRPGSSVDLAELVRFLRDDKKLAPFKLPEQLLLLPTLPRNPVGKVLKRELREQARSGA